jgi:hypothetical protein
MTDIIKGVGLVTLGVVVGLLLGQVRESAIGGVYNTVGEYFPTINVGQSNATTSVNLGRVCMTVYEYDGTATYWFVSTTGSLATSSTNCN